MKEGLGLRIKSWILAKIRWIPDAVRGTDYSKEVVWNADDMPENSRYSMSTGKLCRAVKRYLTGKDLTDASIIDVGCGKGKMIEFFAKYRNWGALDLRE